MSSRGTANGVCQRCSMRRIDYSTSASQRPSKAAKLTNRRLISVQGQDATQFLQGLTTNKIQPERTTGVYSAFLTAQGRVLNDVFIYPTAHSRTFVDTFPISVSRTEPGFLIEVDGSEGSKLFTHLKRHKLRAKITLKLLEEGEWNAWSVWQQQQEEEKKEGSWTSHSLPDGQSGDIAINHGGGRRAMIGCIDARAPGMGWRVILPDQEKPRVGIQSGEGGSVLGEEEEEGKHPEAVPLQTYTIRRIIKGVAEGQGEIWSETALPQEHNIDYMGGIDFRKGCYVGQELTIRTHHTGVVRKRVLPVQMYRRDLTSPPMELSYRPDDPIIQDETGPDTTTTTATTPTWSSLPPSGTSISRIDDDKKRTAGKWLHGIGNIGLALCRLEVMTDTRLPAGRPTWRADHEFEADWIVNADGRHRKCQLNVKAFVPCWHPRHFKPT